MGLEMMNFKMLTMKGFLVESPLKPCPWCRKTPKMNMTLGCDSKPDETWVWKIFCDCNVRVETSVSLRKTAKTKVERLLMKLDDLFYKWNQMNPLPAYEKKVIDIREVPTLCFKR